MPPVLPFRLITSCRWLGHLLRRTAGAANGESSKALEQLQKQLLVRMDWHSLGSFVNWSLKEQQPVMVRKGVGDPQAPLLVWLGWILGPETPVGAHIKYF